MKKKEWNEGLSHLDPDLIEKYVEYKEKIVQKKKTRNAWFYVGTITACFVLIVSAVIIVPMFREIHTLVIDTVDRTDEGTSTIETTDNTQNDDCYDVNDTETTKPPETLSSGDSFESFEDYEKQEKGTYYYIPSYLADEYELSRITKKDGVYVMVEYTVSSTKVIPGEGLDEYSIERLSTLICRYSLYPDGKKALEENYINKGYEATTHDGKIYYRLDEHAENDPDKQAIGYEIAFLKDNDLIFKHLPAVDSFENMMKFADVVKVSIE